MASFELADLQEFARARTRAEYREWSATLDYVEAERARVQAASVFEAQALINGVAFEVAQATGLSEAQVCSRVATAQTVREQAPRCWAAFGVGYVDGIRVREIAHALGRLTRADSKTSLDERAAEYAPGHTVAELRRWLKRIVVRLEPEEFESRAENERAQRIVEVSHTEDGMAYLTAYGPAYVIAAIDKRLTKEAIVIGSDDPRTKAQRRFDLLAAWLTTGEAHETALNADIAIVIDGVAESADGSWQIPNPWVAELAAAGHVFWHRALRHPIKTNILAFESVGYAPPESLAKAIVFRDGTCQAPGCLKPADRCDLDHREPWPHGPTNADNLWALCRRHHQMKGHHVLVPARAA